MSARAPTVRVLAAALALLAPGPARAFLGFADTSFVTVIANPAEAANWAAELERLADQLKAEAGTLQTVGDLRAYAGSPADAVRSLADLGGLSSDVASLAGGARTAADLAASWQALGAASRAAGSAAFLAKAGVSGTMLVFGEPRARSPGLYQDLASDALASATVQGQIASEQSARAAAAAELATAWVQFRSASTESRKQALLSEISQLQAENQVMDARRRALVDDMDVADRQGRAEASARSRASDERLLTESSQLNDDESGRARGSEAQRLATLAKQAPARPEPDYSGLRLWTTADTGGSP